MLAALEKKQQSQKAKQDAKPVILSGGFLISPLFIRLFKNGIHGTILTDPDVFVQRIKT